MTSHITREQVARIAAHQMKGKFGQWIIQNTSPKFANSPTTSQPRRQIRLNVPQNQPGSAAQLIPHLLMQVANQAWKMMTNEEKENFEYAAPRVAHRGRRPPRRAYTNGYQLNAALICGEEFEFRQEILEGRFPDSPIL